jgi:hypothetical protein
MYRIVGADQKEYGPISAEQLRQWISEGRANGQTLVKFEDGPWKPLSAFPEFAAVLPASVPPPLTASSSVPPLPAAELPKNNGMAIAGLICAILGLLCCPGFGVLGFIFSCVALYQISQDPARQSGKVLAIVGLVISLFSFAVFGGLLFSGALHEITRHLRDFRN